MPATRSKKQNNRSHPYPKLGSIKEKPLATDIFGPEKKHGYEMVEFMDAIEDIEPLVYEMKAGCDRPDYGESIMSSEVPWGWKLDIIRWFYSKLKWLVSK